MAKKYPYPAPESLIRASHRASMAAQGFFKLGELKASDDFKTQIFDNLRNMHGWPVREGVQQAGDNAKLSQALRLMMSYNDMCTRAYVRESVSRWYGYGNRKDVSDILFKPENVTALETSVEKALADCSRKYGDPFAFKIVAKQNLTRTFYAVAFPTILIGGLIVQGAKWVFKDRNPPKPPQP